MRVGTWENSRRKQGVEFDALDLGREDRSIALQMRGLFLTRLKEGTSEMQVYVVYKPGACPKVQVLTRVVLRLCASPSRSFAVVLAPRISREKDNCYSAFTEGHKETAGWP